MSVIKVNFLLIYQNYNLVSVWQQNQKYGNNRVATVRGGTEHEVLNSNLELLHYVYVADPLFFHGFLIRLHYVLAAYPTN